VILAGYTNEMENFINSNPGLRSRFNRYIHFEDYSAEELYEIFCLQMKKNEYTMTEDNCNLLKKYFVDILNNKPKDFGNARFVRNLFERAVQNQANRLAKEGNLTRDMLKEIKVEDWNS
jgi:Cdc6-like AAA superfamily ATPase